MPAEKPPLEGEQTLQRIMAERRDKVESLRKAGNNPYRNDFSPSDRLGPVRARYQNTKPEKPPESGITPVDGKTVRVAGRLMARRGFGKTVFAPIRDGSGELQLFLSIDNVDKKDWEEVLPAIDVGDIVGAEGVIFWTKRGEMSLLVKRLVLVTKSLRPLPDKWHGLTDVETRYRQRYLDLAINPDVQEVFRKRSKIISGIRDFFFKRDYLEVETPMMHPIIGGAAARPFVTHHNALDMKLYMRIAPELYLKRLVVGGFDRVFEINRNFRNEGLSRQHNPEFTMLEFYQAYATYEDLMTLTEELLVGLAQDVNGHLKGTFQDIDVNLEPPWKRLTVMDAVTSIGKQPARLFDDMVTAAKVALEAGVAPDDVTHAVLGAAANAPKPTDKPSAADRIKWVERAKETCSALDNRIIAGHLGYLIFEKTVEPKLVDPTFVTQFPLAVSPLARKNEKDPAYCDRFELMAAGCEFANAFSELNDPDDQRSRFLAQVALKGAGAAETMDYDEDYCRALEVGMPSAAGEGVGIDRLTMLLTGQPSIRDVILFPLMRPGS
jgi:lysyl-tRNA synthetase class 2